VRRSIGKIKRGAEQRRTLAYDQLLIATGGGRVCRRGLGAHPQVYTLRHWQDAQRLKQRLASATRLAIVGGGWIGLEIAASARKSGVAVTCSSSSRAVHAFGQYGGVAGAGGIHREQGVDIRTAAARWSWKMITACRSFTATASGKPLMRWWWGSASI
jgi:NADPH-dependent 2,4-dienoyl-CoA reductase/sulfur reductase-like enzyme